MASETARAPSKFCQEFKLGLARQHPDGRSVAAHQQAAFGKLVRWYKSSTTPRGTILVLPTGGGKTFTAVRFLCAKPISDGYKVLWLAHTHHLLEQALDSFEGSVAVIAEPKSALRVRVTSGATGHFPIHAIRHDDDVVIASLQAIAKAEGVDHKSLSAFVESSGGKLFVVFDEAHHAPAPTYRRLVQRLRERCPEMVLLGLTATPTYTDERKKGWLSALFPQGIVYQETPAKLMAARVLAEPIFEEVRTHFEPDFTDRDYANWVGTNRDLPEEIVSYLASSRSRNEYIVGHYLQHRARYGKTIIFADRWSQCEAICTLLNSRGVRAGAVYSRVVLTSGTPEERNLRTADENAKVLAAFRRGELDVLVNVRMLTEGTDMPSVATVFLTRQTTSQILMTQMVGRALRGPAFGGTETAYIVLFIDDWRQRILWAEFGQLEPGQADDLPTESEQRAPTQLISIDLIRRLTSQMDSGENVSATPFLTFLPIGWFRVDFEAQAGSTDELESVRQLVLVYEHDRANFDRFLDAMANEDLSDFEDAAVQLRDVRPRLEEWEGRFCAEASQRIGLALANDLYLLATHVAKNDRERPRFFPFRDRDNHDLDALAERFTDERLDPFSIDGLLRDEYGRQDRLWRQIYSRYEQLKTAYDGCANRLFQARRQPVAPARPSIVISPEPLPDREPSTAIKEQVKSRDQYRCLCCGADASSVLQVDHITAHYHGGGNELDDLQTLCDICNVDKGAGERADFRVTRTALSKLPAAAPRIRLPAVDAANDPETWEQFLRRWVNLFFRCAAVQTVEFENSDGLTSGWAVHLAPGNDPAWPAQHLGPLAKQIRDTMTSAGLPAVPDRLTVIGGPSTEMPAQPSGAASRPTTLDEVLATVFDVERFRVRVRYRDGKKVRGDTARNVAPYPFTAALNGERTVDSWKSLRLLKKCCPSFDSGEYVIQVLDGDGNACYGQRKLRTVRESYR